MHGAVARGALRAGGRAAPAAGGGVDGRGRSLETRPQGGVGGAPEACGAPRQRAAQVGAAGGSLADNAAAGEHCVCGGGDSLPRARVNM